MRKYVEALRPLKVLNSLGQLIHRWLKPHQRAGIYALVKATVVIAALWEYVWLWHTKYYSRHYVEVPLSIAWSLLTVIGGITFAQVGCSAVLKLRSARLRKTRAALHLQVTSLLTEYISGANLEEELDRHAQASPKTFEACATAALLGTRGIALDRMRALPAIIWLRDHWIAKMRKRNESERRYAVEHLALLCDPEATMALEFALEDASPGVVAAAVRGLLRMPGYSDRDALIRSIPGRPFLVRVLTAGELTEEPGVPVAPSQTLWVPSRAATLAQRHQELQMRALAVEEAMRIRLARTTSHPAPETAADVRIGCAVLASSGTMGRDLLRLMSATGAGGEGPAEALGGLLAAAAKGGAG